MNFADVHAHLELFTERERKAVIDRALEKGVKAIITNGGNPDSNRKSLKLQEKYEIVKAALGLYPLDAVGMPYSEVNRELEFMKNGSGKFVAFGEVGLDYEKAADRRKQQDVFESQLELAGKLRKPVIVHSRKAEKEVIETLISSGCKKVVLHAFHGNMKLVKQAIEAGFYFSIPSNVLRSSHFQKLVGITDVKSLLTETDAPFLGPYEGRKSEPAYVSLSVHKIAEIKKEGVGAVAEAIYNNYKKMFKSTEQA